MKRTIAIALSGGIDSLMAAFLLKSQKNNVLGLHFLTGFENHRTGGPSQKSNLNFKVNQIGEQLGIPMHIIDLEKEFNSIVIKYFTRSYLNGLTPNPCLVCNPSIKFGLLMDIAHQLGASHLATGHYARIQKDQYGRMRLLKGKDTLKDQSYFLAFLKQNQLSKIFFPLGNMLKEDVKKMAFRNDLTPVTSQESQDICFIGDSNYMDFLARQPGFNCRPGAIMDLSGNRIGTHKGLHKYTVGQRRGINCPSSEAYYVNRIDSKKNRLIVGRKSDLLSNECEVNSLSWINMRPKMPIQVYTRVRYRHKAVQSTLTEKCHNRVIVSFKDPEPALTPGQGAVFYLGEEVIGGGWIE